MDIVDQSLIGKVFTVPYIDHMISENSVPDSFLRCVSRYVKSDHRTFGKAISEIYEYMSSDYRNEYYYKNTLFNELLIRKHDLYTTAALTELPIADSKADFIMINGKGIVYEIKTDLDNLYRLKNQINDYYKVFSYVNVVVSKRQSGKVKEFLNESKVGMYELTEHGNLVCRKQAMCSRSNLSYEAMFQVLRKAEFEEILLQQYGKLPQVNNFEYYQECLKWIKEINILTLQKKVMSCLKQRTVLVVNNLFEDNVPYELRFYAYFSKKYRSNYEEIDKFLNKEVGV